MHELDLSIEQLEDAIASAYENHLVASGRLTRQQASNAQYSYAIYEVYPDAERPSPEERKSRFRAFAVNILYFNLEEKKALLKTKLCDEAQYCKNRNSEGINIILTTLDGIVSAVVGYPIPAAVVLAWAVKKGWLDKLCECPE